jgi:hypothetical protein
MAWEVGVTNMYSHAHRRRRRVVGSILAIYNFQVFQSSKGFCLENDMLEFQDF